MKSHKLSVVVPCFNEAGNVSLLIEKFCKLVQKFPDSIEIIFVDGASTDGTSEMLETELQALDSEKFKLILQKKRLGYGRDIITALSHATGDVLAWTHADLQTDPADLLKAYQLYVYEFEQGNIVFVKGHRYNRALLESFFSFAMQCLVACILRIYLTDINAQPKLFSKKFYQQYLKENAPSDFSLDLCALYHAKQNNILIKTIPVYFAQRLYGEAKGGGGGWIARFSLIKRTVRYIFRFRYMCTSR